MLSNGKKKSKRMKWMYKRKIIIFWIVILRRIIMRWKTSKVKLKYKCLVKLIVKPINLKQVTLLCSVKLKWLTERYKHKHKLKLLELRLKPKLLTQNVKSIVKLMKL